MAKDLTGRPARGSEVLPERDEWRLWRDVLRRALRQEPDGTALRDLRDEVACQEPLAGHEYYSEAAARVGRDPGLGQGTVARCWELFAAAKAREGRVDFADLAGHRGLADQRAKHRGRS